MAEGFGGRGCALTAPRPPSESSRLLSHEASMTPRPPTDFRRHHEDPTLKLDNGPAQVQAPFASTILGTERPGPLSRTRHCIRVNSSPKERYENVIDEFL